MSAAAGPDIVQDGLVLCLDAADKKSLLAPPTTNLANNSNGTINWYASGLGGSGVTSSTVDANNYHYRFALNKNSNSYASGRFNFDHTNLTGGETYIISYKYKITSGSGTFYITDFCDISVNSNRVTTDIGDGWYYETAYGTRSSYTETYDFFDFYASDSLTVDIKEMQVEHTSASSPLATPFVSYQRKWQDRQGSNDGTPVNMSDQASYSSNNGGYLMFDGAGDYCSHGVITGLSSTSVTTDCWVRFNGSLDSNDRKIFCYKKSLGSPYAAFQLRKGLGSTGLYYQFNTSGTWRTVSITDAMTSGDTWYNYTIVHDGLYIYVYINGELEVSSGQQGASIDYSSVSDFLLGYRANSEYWKGDIASFRIYDKALTAAEVLQNYNATKSRFGL